MKKHIYILTLLLTCFSARVLAQQSGKVFLPYLEGINIKKDYQLSTTKLLRNYIEMENRFQVVMVENKDTLFDADRPLEALKSKAQEMGAAYFIKGSLNRIGESVIVNITLIETATGNKVWFDQLKAMGPEDLDPIMQRIGKALGTGNKAAADNDIYAVTNNESASLKQKQTNNSFGVGIGGMQMLTPGNMQLTNLSAIWNFDARNFIMGIRTSLALNTRTDYTLFHLGLEMYRPHTTKSNTLFYGGGVGYSATDLGGGGSGMSLNAGGGYLINRNSAASVQLGLNYFYSLFLLSNNQSPMGLELRAAIFFNQ